MQTNYRKKNAKLTLAQARQIRARAAAGEYALDLAAEFSVNPGSVYDVLRYEIHANRITAKLPDDVAIKFEAAAVAAGHSVEDWASRLLARSVTK